MKCPVAFRPPGSFRRGRATRQARLPSRQRRAAAGDRGARGREAGLACRGGAARRTASGITDGAGHFIAGVVMITAGYSAEGKYSYYFLVPSPIRVGNIDLPAGDYAFGRPRSPDALKGSFYQAATAGGAERVRLFRLAWDVAVSSFGSRQALYERFFSGDPVRHAVPESWTKAPPAPKARRSKSRRQQS